MGVCNCSMFCCSLLYVHSSIAIILMGKRELVVLLNLSSWSLVMVELLSLAVPRGCLRFGIVVFPDHTHLLFLSCTDPFLIALSVKSVTRKWSCRLCYVVLVLHIFYIYFTGSSKRRNSINKSSSSSSSSSFSSSSSSSS